MRKYSSYKCNVCKKPYVDLAGWSRHMENVHPEEIPQGYTSARYFYYLKTGKTHSNCIVCKKKTEWNEGSGKYERFCKDPKCKEKYREMFKQRMMDTYGKVHLLNDPEKQREMLSNRKISGKYEFSDGGSIGYVGKYEEDFLKMMDTMIKCNSNDIMSPSPHNYEYDYKNIDDKENEGKKIYIPDFFIPSLNLEIEVKSHENKHHKFLRVDKVKEECKDKAMTNIPNRNYIKIVDKDYSKFFEYLLDLKSQVEEKVSKKVIVNESIVEDIYNPDEIMLKNINSISVILNKYYDDSMEITLESNIDSTKKYPIYIILMHSGTLLANVIQKSTGHEFSHACLALNIKLDPLYSFGRKDMSMKDTGFVTNSPQHEFFKKYKTKYAVYRLMVDKRSIDKMRNRLGFFEDNKDIFRYDVPGLVYNFIQKEREVENKYFCSRFVAEIINSGKNLAKNPSLYKPNELGTLDDIKLIAKGDDFSKYKMGGK